MKEARQGNQKIEAHSLNHKSMVWYGYGMIPVSCELFELLYELHALRSDHEEATIHQAMDGAVERDLVFDR